MSLRTRVAVLVKQIPRFEDMRLGEGGRLDRSSGDEREINPYCRRALAKGIEIAHAYAWGSVAISMGPPSARDSLREALAAGAESAVLVTDPRLAGADTLVTSRVLAEVLRREGPFPLVLCGLNSVDGDTGQVGPEVAEMLGATFVSGARMLEVRGDEVYALCERDDGTREVVAKLPAVISVTERLCKPAKAPAAVWGEIPPERVRCYDRESLGMTVSGGDSPTVVGELRVVRHERKRLRVSTAMPSAVRELAHTVVAGLEAPAATGSERYDEAVPGYAPQGAEPCVGVIIEPGRPELARELLGKAAVLARSRDGSAVAITFERADMGELRSWGADQVRASALGLHEAGAARSIGTWLDEVRPKIVLGPSTSWGREVMGRVAARRGAGLVGDAIDIESDEAGMVYWKAALAGQLVAAIRCTSDVEMVTVRPGALPRLAPRPRLEVQEDAVAQEEAPPNGSLRLLSEQRDESMQALRRARVVIGVGMGVAPEEYERLEDLRCLLGAEIAATRKVTDRGWLPRGRQIGVTGINIAPALYIALGVGGSFNHMAGLQRASTVIAVNRDPESEMFEAADVGVVGEWQEVVEGLTTELRSMYKPVGAS